jgi:gamma-glutamyltranspeptidase / glutathione hydrolase
VVEDGQEIDREVPLSLNFAVEYQKGMIIVAGCLLLFGVLIVVLQGSAQKFAEGESGMAATTTPSATRAADDILAAGGNAIDAAAAHFALMVTDPANASLGGRTQILVRLSDGRMFEIDGATQAPQGVTRSLSLPEGDRHGYAVAPIPGNLAALDLLMRRYGKLPLAEVMRPAIDLAEQGFDVTPGVARTWVATGPQLRKNPGARANFLADGAKPYAAGARFRQPQLAATLREIARSGPDAFYRGPIAQTIAQDMQAGQGYITEGDLAGYRALEGPVVRTIYRGYEVAAAGGRAWGDTLVEMLNIAHHFSFGQEPTAAEFHLLARIISTALSDRPQELQTLRPKKHGLAVAEVSSAQFALDRAQAIESGLHSKPHASTEQKRVEPHDTTHLAVMDTEGNTVSQTTSIGPSFGSRVATAELGFLYAHSYRMQADPTPGARDETEMTPTILSRDGQPFLAIGGAGSERIPCAILQVIVNVIDRGLPLDQAVAAPRMFASGDVLVLNAAFPAALTTEMRERGWQVKRGEQDFRQHLGIVQTVQYNPRTGVFSGAADAAYDGTASGPQK